ncbi:MAG: hypothetical protein N2422_12140 [Rhodobacteraceae bacterium]|nr:hypothetical protein [Paracoccaceae bacterium]
MRGAAARAAALLALAALPAAAGPGTPGPDYFRGLYERVGRSAASAVPGGALDDLVRIEPDGLALAVHACGVLPVRLRFAPWSLGENFLTGQSGGDTLVCQFHNNGENRPLLTCESAGGARFTLWPSPRDFRDGQLDCAGPG